MIPEIWIAVSTVCIWSSIGGKEIFVDDSVKAADYWRVGEPVETKVEPYCIEQIQISTVPVIAKEGQTVKRLCDFVGHNYQEIVTGTRMTADMLPGDKWETHSECIYCHKKRRKVTTETWEEIVP